MDEAQYDIHQEHGHYVLKVNGRFYGSYDCFMEAVKDAVQDKVKNRQKGGMEL